MARTDFRQVERRLADSSHSDLCLLLPPWGLQGPAEPVTRGEGLAGEGTDISVSGWSCALRWVPRGPVGAGWGWPYISILFSQL